jgi:hypothetical protein
MPVNGAWQGATVSKVAAVGVQVCSAAQQAVEAHEAWLPFLGGATALCS